MQNKLKKLPWLDIDQAFPDASMAWDESSDAPGLLAVGAPLSVARLQEAYSKGIFPELSACFLSALWLKSSFTSSVFLN